MEYREIVEAFKSLNALAKEEKFVYSLTSSSLQQALNGEKLTNPITIAISFSTLLKLKFFYPEKLNLPPDNSFDEFFPSLQLGNVVFNLYILTESNRDIISSRLINKVLSKVNKGKWCDILLILDEIFSDEPSIWSYLYRDNDEIIKLDAITRMNPYYYNVVKIEDEEVPYLDYFKNEIKNDVA
ncbi:hypothetical protein ACM0IS_00060 [Mycoplasma aquilae ATCC BAA-1896]|uniref:hypothetical protein n=1 Tax=Mycoplasma aquilae TaxID=1312741 RepID=UPI003A87D025